MAIRYAWSKTDPVATHDYNCIWCKKVIPTGRVHVRYVWQDENRTKYSDHYHVECWEEMNHD